MKTLAVLTNGGDTCALNASIRSIRDNAYYAGYKKIYGIRRGYQGLIDGWIDDITHKEIDPKIGGSCLGSLRASPTIKCTDKEKEESGKPYKIDEYICEEMAKCLSDYRIDVLVVIGGDGTLQSTTAFQEWVNSERASRRFRSFHIIGFLKTIDNDIRTFTNFKGIEVSLCPGFPSAVEKIAKCAEDLRVTARTAERAFSVETMGRDAGWLAASATYGGAEILLVPEQMKLWKNISGIPEEYPEDKEITKSLMEKMVDELVDFYIKNRNVLIAVAEGFEPSVEIQKIEEFRKVIRDLFGPRKKVGATELVAMLVSPVLEYFFWCLSRLCKLHNEVSDISNLIRKVIKEANVLDIGNKYHNAVDDPKHPLRDWNVENKLRSILGLDEIDNAQTQDEKKNMNRYKQNNESKRSNDKKKCMKKLLIIPPFKFEIRPHRTDYLPRSGHPSSYDYRFATVLGQKVHQMLLDGEFGTVPALKEVVPYGDLTLDAIRTIPIDEIITQNFKSEDYFNKEFPLHVSERITSFFRTIMTGPSELDKAISDIKVVL